MSVIHFVIFFLAIILARIGLYFFLRHPLARVMLRWNRRNQNLPFSKVKTVAILGSGGHTTELIFVVSYLNPEKYRKYYIIASTDKRSYSKLSQYQNVSESEDVFYIPRSREVHQSFFSSIFSTLRAFFCSIPIIFRIKPELIICNGPGTCVPVCFAAFLLKFLFLSDAKVIFIESVCRVKTLSLSAMILKLFVNELFVQWPELRIRFPDTRYIGRL